MIFLSGISLDVEIKDLIVPEEAKRFSNVTLECKYESNTKPISFLKWLHNDFDFLKKVFFVTEYHSMFFLFGLLICL